MAYLAPEIPALSITYNTGNIRPLGNNFPLVPSPGSLWDFLNQHEDFSIYKYLVIKAQLEPQFNESQANITVFVPSDKHMIKLYPMNTFKNMEKHQALRMINFNSLRNKITMKELLSSGSMKLDTRARGHPLYSESDGKTLSLMGDQGDFSKVIKGDIIVNNGIVHITNTFLLPEMS